MKKIDTFQRILFLRNKLKAIQQASWEISQLEKRYPFESISDSDFPELLQAYENQLSQFKKIVEGLDENEKEKNT